MRFKIKEPEIKDPFLRELKKNINHISFPNEEITIYEKKNKLNYEFHRMLGVAELFRLEPFYVQMLNTIISEA